VIIDHVRPPRVVPQVLKRLTEVAAMERVPCSDDGLEALVFTAEGDMRQALNNLQATHAGFGRVDVDNVFKVCDQPHPLVVKVRGPVPVPRRLPAARVQGLTRV
jgi:DNA polymerase III delta prime subunit